MPSTGFVIRSPLETALDYGELGLAVFPVARDCRRPLTLHGCYDASTDAEAIRRLWNGRGSTNIALATGAASGVFAIDVDVKDGRNGFGALSALEARHGALPRTWRSITPSGGAHIFLAQPGGRALRNRVNLPVAGFHSSGLDVRSTGASVALPPSRKTGGTYSWETDPLAAPLASAPAWLLDLIDPPKIERLARPTLAPVSVDRIAKYVAAAVNRGCDALSRMAPGSGRNDELFRLSARLGEFVAAGALPQDTAEAELLEAANACGLVREDGTQAVRATIASGLRRGLTKPAMFPA